MANRTTQFESLETRNLLTFAAADPGFGTGGRLAIETNTVNFNRPATEVDDGRLVVRGTDVLRFLRSDGSPDLKRGRDGVLNLVRDGEVIKDLAVDQATGQIAILRAVLINGQENGTFSLQLYDAKGRTSRRINVTDSNPTLQPTFVRFDGHGGVYVASIITTRSNSTATFVGVELRLQRFDSSLMVDASFGTNGTVTQSLDSHVDVDEDSVRSLGLLVDGSGRAYFLFDEYDYEERYLGGDGAWKAIRFSRSGVADPSYGANDTAVRGILGYNDHTDDSMWRVDFQDAAVDANGQLYVLYTRTSSSDYVGGEQGIELVSFHADGTPARSQAVDIGRHLGDGLGTARLALDSGGDLYVAIGSNQRLEIHRLAGDTLKPVDGWSTWGDYITTTSEASAYGGLLVNRDGRLLAVDAGGIYAINGPTDSIAPNVGNGRAVLLADGTLLVRGTSKADTIVLRRKAGAWLVEINGKKTTFVSGIHGVLIQSGNGADSVSIAGNFSVSAFVEAGAGNDSVTGGSASATLVGGSGNDLLRTGGSNDHLYGQDGNDTLIGGDGADELFGGKGDDLLTAFNALDSIINNNDSYTDFLYGGAGADRLRMDDAPAWEYDRTDAGDDDQIIRYVAP